MSSSENNKDSIKVIIESQSERRRLEKHRRKEVFDAICILIDPISSEVLKEQVYLIKLNFLKKIF